MSSVVIAGDTSGTVTLQAPAVAGTTVLTLPTTSGTLVTTGGGSTGSFTTLTSTEASSFATSSGNVGIGTASPTAKLFVNSGTTGVHAATFYSNGAASTTGLNSYGITLTGNLSSGAAECNIVYGSAGAGLAFNSWNGTTQTERMRINSSGYVGIGTNNPTSSLVVSGAIQSTPTVDGVHLGTASGYAVMEMCGTAVTGCIIDFTKSGSDAPGRILYSHNDNSMYFATNGSEKMRIASSGNVGIGSSSPGSKLVVSATSGQCALELTGSGFPVARVYPQVGYRGVSTEQGNTGETTDGMFYAFNATAGSTSWAYYGAQSAVSGVVYKVYGNGNVVNANNSYGSISDVKLKENIVDATPKLDNICKLQVRNFNFIKTPEQKQLGLIAQEVETVFPGLIDEVPDRDEDGQIIEGQFTKNVKYSVLVPMLIKAIQELKAEVDALKAGAK